MAASFTFTQGTARTKCVFLICFSGLPYHCSSETQDEDPCQAPHREITCDLRFTLLLQRLCFSNITVAAPPSLVLYILYIRLSSLAAQETHSLSLADRSLLRLLCLSVPLYRLWLLHPTSYNLCLHRDPIDSVSTRSLPSLYPYLHSFEKMFFAHVLAIVFAVFSAVTPTQAKAVFAHFIVSSTTCLEIVDSVVLIFLHRLAILLPLLMTTGLTTFKRRKPPTSMDSH